MTEHLSPAPVTTTKTEILLRALATPSLLSPSTVEGFTYNLQGQLQLEQQQQRQPQVQPNSEQAQAKEQQD